MKIRDVIFLSNACKRLFYSAAVLRTKDISPLGKWNSSSQLTSDDKLRTRSKKLDSVAFREDSWGDASIAALDKIYERELLKRRLEAKYLAKVDAKNSRG